MVGQQHLLAPGKPLYQIINQHIDISLLLWGPPGCGKTTFAYVLSKTLQVPFETFNASIENKAKLQKLVEKHPEQTNQADSRLSFASLRIRTYLTGWYYN